MLSPSNQNQGLNLPLRIEIEQSRERAKMFAPEVKDSIGESDEGKPPEVITPDKPADKPEESKE